MSCNQPKGLRVEAREQWSTGNRARIYHGQLGARFGSDVRITYEGEDVLKDKKPAEKPKPPQ